MKVKICDFVCNSKISNLFPSEFSKKYPYFAVMLKDSFQELTNTLPASVKLIVVSKFRNMEEIRKIYDKGHRDFAENRVQALLERKEALPDDIRWHLIGHLQTNKVKYIAPFIYMVQSMDSIKIMKELNKHAELNRRVIPCLFQIKISKDENKYGFEFKELCRLLNEEVHLSFSNLSWHGVMGMSTLTTDSSIVRKEFESLKQYFTTLKKDYFNHNKEFLEISMGMSGDYHTAIECGSTMVRIGSAVFEKD